MVIDNPILNSPFAKPDRHFKFESGSITDEIVHGRRKSTYFTPVPQPKKRGAVKQMFAWDEEREEENELINQIRQRVNNWRTAQYPHTTRTTRRLLAYWTNPDRERRLFFCQVEALETAIYITEAAQKDGASWIENRLREANDEANPGLFRLALKMATGTGKTVVMAMLIAWQALNKLDNPQDKRFSDAFLIVTPGITIRDRLRVLLPNDPQNYYVARDILPTFDLERLGQAKIVITNFHTFMPRELIQASSLTKAILGKTEGVFTESPDQVVRRVCRDFGSKKNIIVINDEAHHCYRRKADADSKISQDEKQSVEEARVWISGLEAIQAKLGIRAVYDLSATPFFLSGSGYREGTLFPWVVSDFSLIDAIESGIVKIPRVPVADNAASGDMPTNRELWYRIRDDLPTRKGESKRQMPAKLEGALLSLYTSYREQYEEWRRSLEALGQRSNRQTPPVMIVVCSNTMVSRMVYEWIAGYEKTLDDGSSVIVPGHLDIFRNEDGRRWLPRPNTILVDSAQLESGEGLSDDFKQVAALEIEMFRNEYRQRYPERDPSAITESELMREVLNTVGKEGRLGEHVKCVVSVSMLSEGWDAQTVTHILGVRAFSTQLICEQVVGRALRRMSYTPNAQDRFEPEYAEIYGVPFSFIRSSAKASSAQAKKPSYRVRALPERAHAAIRFPRLVGYRYDMREGQLDCEFGAETHFTLSTEHVPTRTETSSIFGESQFQSLDELRQVRQQRVAFHLASKLMGKYYNDGEGGLKHWHFPRLLEISKAWLNECVRYKDETFEGMLMMAEHSEEAVERIYRAIIGKSADERTLRPILDSKRPEGSTHEVDFDTFREVYQTREDKCHLNYAALDSDWEATVLERLEQMPEVLAYAKNDRLGLNIPYIVHGQERHYVPDYLTLMQVGDEVLHVLIEVTGLKDAKKAVKVDTARQLWIPAVNNHGGYGRWAFVEVTDAFDTTNILRRALGLSAL
jgi:type III restriction enzyme